MLRLALAIGLLLQGSPANKEGYSIASVSSAISPDAVLGSLGSGLICVPAGKLLWWHLARADSAAWVDAGQRALGDAGLGASPRLAEAGPSAARYRVSLSIRAIKLNLCLAWMGIGRKPRGKGMMTVEVAVRDSVDKVDLPSRTIDIDLDLRGRDPRKDESVLTQAIGDAVRTFIAMRPAG